MTIDTTQAKNHMEGRYIPPGVMVLLSEDGAWRTFPAQPGAHIIPEIEVRFDMRGVNEHTISNYAGRLRAMADALDTMFAEHLHNLHDKNARVSRALQELLCTLEEQRLDSEDVRDVRNLFASIDVGG